MLFKRLFCVLFVLLSYDKCKAQFSDNFSDGDLTSNPVWLGDTTAFIINAENSLQLNAPAETGEKYIYTISEAIENATWEFDVRFDFNPSSSNYADIFLCVDSENRESASGYFVRIGGTQDEVSLYRKDGASISKITDGRDKIIDSSAPSLRIKTVRDTKGNWQLFSDVGLTGNFEPEGEVFDDTYLGSSYFGIFCDYTSTRSNKFFFDNFVVSGSPKSDVAPPSLVSLSVIDERTLELVFSEKVKLNDDQPKGHFLENCDMSQPEAAEIYEDSIVHLTFANPFPENTLCDLLINSIADRAQNVLSDTSLAFQYQPPAQPGFNELLITEIMADPSSNVELPEYLYLEIYNPTDHSWEIKNLSLKIRDRANTLKDFEIHPGEYMILCPNAAVESFQEYGKVLGVSNWKALLNSGDTLSLSNRYDEQVFSLAYQKDWYDDLEKSEGGYSLEMVDSSNPCGEKSNWKASRHASGGTPGHANSVRESNPDLKGPVMETIFPEKENLLAIQFDEKLLINSFHTDNISVTPALGIAESYFSEPLRKTIFLTLSEKLVEKQVYTLSVSGMKDCIGNPASHHSAEFVLPENADSLDILFNEIMFNPVPVGVDFIELINISDKFINLQHWKFLREKDGVIEESKVLTHSHLTLKPGEIIVFTEDRDVLVGQFPHSAEGVVIETDIPAMNDDEGTLLLTDGDGRVIDRLYYHENFHHPMIENEEGVSLERINYANGSGHSEAWQSAASTVGFATPGFKNSQFLRTENTQIFSIEPKVFAPDNDGFRDFTSINFSLSNNYLASLFIYDISGRRVRQLLNNQNLPTEGYIVWEGEDDHGNKVNMGNYVVFFELIGPNGERKIYKESVAVAAKF